MPEADQLIVLPLDVTSPDSISRTLEIAGPIDVLVNNAGLGLFGAFEATPMAMTQAVLPGFRERRSGVVVSVTSSATLLPMPLVAAYTASKTAVEGFTASLAYELQSFNVRVKLVEPGYAPTTRFTENGAQRMQGLIPGAYAWYVQSVFASLGTAAAFTRESDVAEAVWLAANDASPRLHYPAGADAVTLSRAA